MKTFFNQTKGRKGEERMDKIYYYKLVRVDIRGKVGKRSKTFFSFENDLEVGHTYLHLGSGFPGLQLFLSVTVEELGN